MAVLRMVLLRSGALLCILPTKVVTALFWLLIGRMLVGGLVALL